MKLFKNQLSFLARFICGPNENRAMLQSINVEEQRMVATNGHLAAKVVAHAEIPCTLDGVMVKNALKVWPKNEEVMFVDEERTQHDPKFLHFRHDHMPPVVKTEGNFIDIDKAWPKEPVYRIYLAPSYVKMIAEGFKAYKPGNPMCLELPEDPKTPVTFSIGDDQVILMPVKGDKQTGPLNSHTLIHAWARNMSKSYNVATCYEDHRVPRSKGCCGFPSDECL